MTTFEPLTFPHYSVQTPFVLILDVVEVQTSYVDDIHILMYSMSSAGFGWYDSSPLQPLDP